MLPTLRSFLCLVVLACSACVSVAGGTGGISPSQFKFEPVVLNDEPGPGGWKAARLVIGLLRFPDEPDLVTCFVLVEVPEASRYGVISDEFAALASARAADVAAAQVSGQGYFSAELCRRFMETMSERLGAVIPGCRVRKFLP
jgi:hypothetical protein